MADDEERFVRTMAPTAPQKIPMRCCRRGSVRTAIAMTSALSPANVKSMTTILSQLRMNAQCIEKLFLQQTPFEMKKFGRVF